VVDLAGRPWRAGSRADPDRRVSDGRWRLAPLGIGWPPTGGGSLRGWTERRRSRSASVPQGEASANSTDIGGQLPYQAFARRRQLPPCIEAASPFEGPCLWSTALAYIGAPLVVDGFPQSSTTSPAPRATLPARGQLPPNWGSSPVGAALPHRGSFLRIGGLVFHVAGSFARWETASPASEQLSPRLGRTGFRLRTQMFRFRGGRFPRRGPS
jgi:hypothetical protein